jgi:hypothetical protein
MLNAAGFFLLQVNKRPSFSDVIDIGVGKRGKFPDLWNFFF